MFSHFFSWLEGDNDVHKQGNMWTIVCHHIPIHTGLGAGIIIEKEINGV